MPTSQKLTFPGASGATLAARLDLPARPPSAYALFAHCFTCSKDVVAASRIARALAQHGIGVVRFDFTGLGSSDGDFAHTNFSSNIADLIAAADFMREELQAPAIMIGHSLGGAATLIAAGEVPECRAVATIGAPHDPAHVKHLLSAGLGEIEMSGEADVTIAGRSFTIKKQFIDDLDAQNLERHVSGLKRPLLILHSPIDETVSIDNARLIYEAARHPKSFVSLDSADHLLRNPRDSTYVASVLSAWSARYTEETVAESLPKQPPGCVLVQESGFGDFQQKVRVADHDVFHADEPESLGGNDTGPGPYDLVLAGLGACTSMTLRMYANHKEWPLERVSVKLRHEKRHREDAAEFDKAKKIDHIDRSIEIRGRELTDTQRQRLFEIADRCPVHRTLESKVVIETHASDLTPGDETP
ncbi:MAG: alpha/beta fold hydrolase [Myxococcota bacterium]